MTKFVYMPHGVIRTRAEFLALVAEAEEFYSRWDDAQVDEYNEFIFHQKTAAMFRGLDLDIDAYFNPANSRHRENIRAEILIVDREMDAKKRAHDDNR